MEKPLPSKHVLHISACVQVDSRTRTLHEPLPPSRNERPYDTCASSSFRLIKSSRASPMNSIGSAGWATTSEERASDRGSPTVRFKNSASIAAEPTAAAMILLCRRATLCQRRYLVAEVKRREKGRQSQGGRRRICAAAVAERAVSKRVRDEEPGSVFVFFVVMCVGDA